MSYYFRSDVYIDTIKSMNDLKVRYDIQERIGCGSYGTVFKAIDLHSNEVKAMKIAEKEENSVRNHQEIQILFKIEHNNIIKLSKVFETSKKTCFIFEYCPRDLQKILVFRKFLEEFEVNLIMKYLISAVNYLHLNLIVHRDIKIENILFTNNPDDPNDEWYVKLIDFGLSAIRTKRLSFDGGNIMFVDICGTPQYMAPEIPTKSYGYQCDIWSIGVMFYLLIKGKFPYYLSEELQECLDLEGAKKLFNNLVIDYDSLTCSRTCIRLIKRCLTVNPAMRITAGEILNDSWILGENEISKKSTNILFLMDEFNRKTLDIKTMSSASIEIENIDLDKESKNIKVNGLFDNRINQSKPSPSPDIENPDKMIKITSSRRTEKK